MDVISGFERFADRRSPSADGSNIWTAWRAEDDMVGGFEDVACWIAAGRGPCAGRFCRSDPFRLDLSESLRCDEIATSVVRRFCLQWWSINRIEYVCTYVLCPARHKA